MSNAEVVFGDSICIFTIMRSTYLSILFDFHNIQMKNPKIIKELPVFINYVPRRKLSSDLFLLAII